MACNRKACIHSLVPLREDSSSSFLATWIFFSFFANLGETACLYLLHLMEPKAIKADRCGRVEMLLHRGIASTQGSRDRGGGGCGISLRLLLDHRRDDQPLLRKREQNPPDRLRSLSGKTMLATGTHVSQIHPGIHLRAHGGSCREPG